MHVHYALKADIPFSNEIGADAKSAVEAAVKEANEKAFSKGVLKGVAPEEIGRITVWDVEENLLFLGIESGGYTRARDALSRFRKIVAQALGKHHLGRRETRVREFQVSVTGDVPEGIFTKLNPYLILTRKFSMQSSRKICSEFLFWEKAVQPDFHTLH